MTMVTLAVIMITLAVCAKNLNDVMNNNAASSK